MFLFQWFVDNNGGQPGQIVLFRTVDPNRVDTIEAGGILIALQEQDTLGKSSTLIIILGFWMDGYYLCDEKLVYNWLMIITFHCKFFESHLYEG